MKKAIYLFFALTLVFALVYVTNNQKSDIDLLKEKHQTYLDASPFKETQVLSKQERKDLGLPPNAYYEQVWELTIDPATGRPHPERTEELQTRLREERAVATGTRGVGGDTANPWIDRGPNNVGGRTRAIMFDPNDSDFNRVFAGGVSGGLWVNEDITDSNASWTLVPGVPASISPSVIISDPNNSNTFYLGSGESYTSGQAVGSGIWKSTDGGATWARILGGVNNGVTNGNQVINGIFYINDIIARDIGGITELYAAVAGAFYGSASTPNNFIGINDQGLYKSLDNGNNWLPISITEGNGTPKNPNDLELDINNNIWMSTTRSSWGFTGGDIYRSSDGINFTEVGSVPGAERTEIEPSNTDANLLYVAANVPVGSANRADLFTITYDSGPGTITTTQITTEPNDADGGIPATDYTRAQAFYDLPIELDNNGNLYVGGIDLFRSEDLGASWDQISRWNGSISSATSIVHADQHAIVFRPGTGNEDKVLFGTDGGLFYSDDITTAATSTVAIQARNKDYNTVQFYYGAIQEVGNAGDDLGAGAQDNGTLFSLNSNAGANGFVDPVGGDGGYTEIDENGQYAITTYPGNNHRFLSIVSSSFYNISSGTGGNFINEAGFDNALNILYTNGTLGNTARIERNANINGGSAGAVDRTILTDALLTSSPSAFKVSPYTTGSTKLFVGLRNGTVLQLDNADTTPIWSDISDSGFVGSISDIAFGLNEQEIFVSMHNYGVTSIWFTSDGGTNWSSIEGDFPDIPVKCILQNPLIPEEVIIGTELGIWATADYTAANITWVPTTNGMSDVTVLDLDLRASDNTILATTFGRGLFTSQFTNQPLSVVENTLVENTIKLYPTLSDGSFSVRSNTLNGQALIELFDVNGKKVLSQTFTLTNASQLFDTQLKSGVYFVNISVDNLKETSKLVIK